MLDLRPNCENCNKSLPPASGEAMICTFECTFCVECVRDVLENVCPNCGGGFEKRPVRPVGELVKYPASEAAVLKPVDIEVFRDLRERMKDVGPEDR